LRTLFKPASDNKLHATRPVFMWQANGLHSEFFLIAGNFKLRSHKHDSKNQMILVNQHGLSMCSNHSTPQVYSVDAYGATVISRLFWFLCLGSGSLGLEISEDKPSESEMSLETE
jgi:hypothetical protein